MRVRDKFRKNSAPTLSKLIRYFLRSPLIPISLKNTLWSIAEKYVSFYGVEGFSSLNNGTYMKVNTSKMVEKQIYYFGEWEPFFTRYLMDTQNSDNEIFLDIGANIGYFTLITSAIFNQVLAIEASPSIHHRLSENIKFNQLNNVISYNVAVGENKGKANFYFDDAQSGGSSLLAGGSRRLEAEVGVAPLFDIIPEKTLDKITFIKVDVEGFEHVVMSQIFDNLESMNEKLKIMVEYGPSREGNLWHWIERFTNSDFSAHFLQGPYDVKEYTDRSLRSALVKVTSKPDIFCDLLLIRSIN